MIMQQQRSKLVWIVAILVAFFFFIDPFRFFNGDRVPTVRVDRETQTELALFVSSAKSAADVVVDLLQTNDVVLIGETGYASQHVEFAADLIPVLDSAGVHHFGYQYASTADQALIDDLITSSVFDEQLARTILFNHLSVLGFQEHVEVFRAAWEVNRRKNLSDQPFRIIALSNQLDYEAITAEDDIEDPEVMKRVFASGVPDAVMAQTISREFLDQHVKAVAFLQIDHALTGFQRQGYEEELRAIGFDGIRRAGNTLRAEYGERVVTAALHGPVQNARSRSGFGYPTGSIIENAVGALEDGASIGFRTAASPFAEVPMVGDIPAADGDGEVTLSNYTDAYLVVAPLARLTAITPISDFITAENLEEAVRTFPGVSPEDVTVDDMNQFIAGNAESMAKVFAAFE